MGQWIGATDEEPLVVNIQEEATVAGLHTLISHPQTLTLGLLRRSFAIPLPPGPYQQELCQTLLREDWLWFLDTYAHVKTHIRSGLPLLPSVEGAV